MNASLQEGDVVPDFTLLMGTKDGRRPFTLSKELGQGPVVFAFYPLAFTSVCTTQMCDFRDNIKVFESLKAKVFGFSVDSAPTNAQFAKYHDLSFGLVSDPNREVAPRLGMIAERPVVGVNQVTKRGVIVLDKTGKIVWKWVTDDTSQWPGVADVRKAVEAASQ